MSYPLPLTRTEAYLAYKAGVIQQSELKPSLAVPRIGIDAWLAYWTELTNDYPKNPDGTPMILQKEEEYIAYLCGVIDTYPEKCLRRVGAYLRYIISARWGRPDHPLNREELYLSLIKTQFIPSGDPSSDIVIDGTAKAAFVDVKMYGDTFQQSYTGKNLLKFVPSTSGLNGLTVNYNEASGIVRVSGTPTQNWSNIDSTTKIMSLKAGSYILSVDNPSPLYRLNFRIYDPTASGGYLDLHGGEGGNYVKFTLDHDINDVVMRVYIDHNYDMTSVDWSFKIMLESGSEITLPYEPYVGETPSPNPDYPQAIQTVTGLQTVTVEGKNILSSAWETGAYSNETGEKVGGSETVRTKDKVKVEPNTTYICSRGGSGVAMNIGEYNESQGFIRRIYVAAGEPFTTSSTTQYITLWRGVTGGLAEMMVEKGSSITTYEPYNKRDYPIDLGDIKLCGLGDDGNGEPLYEDYIWEDGDDWKVHKECDSGTSNIQINGIDINSSGPFTVSRVGAFCSLRVDNPSIDYNNTLGRALASENIGIYKLDTSVIGNAAAESMQDGTFCQRQGTNDRIYFRNSAYAGKTGEQIRAIIAATQLGGTNCWYPLATPTDTIITDTNLIDQLNALKQGGSEEGTTYIRVSATDPNLPAKLYVEAAKYV